jgi:hypothetical protein
VPGSVLLNLRGPKEETREEGDRKLPKPRPKPHGIPMRIALFSRWHLPLVRATLVLGSCHVVASSTAIVGVAGMMRIYPIVKSVSRPEFKHPSIFTDPSFSLVSLLIGDSV